MASTGVEGVASFKYLPFQAPSEGSVHSKSGPRPRPQGPASPTPFPSLGGLELDGEAVEGLWALGFTLTDVKQSKTKQKRVFNRKKIRGTERASTMARYSIWLCPKLASLGRVSHAQHCSRLSRHRSSSRPSAAEAAPGGPGGVVS